MSVLLRQAHGFQCLCSLRENHHPNGFVVTKGPHMSYPSVSFYATSSAAGAHLDEDDNLAAGRFKEPLRFEAEVVKRLLHLTEGLAECVGPSEDARRADDAGGLVKLKVGSDQASAVACRDHLPHDLGNSEPLIGHAEPVDVLLRHRPRSIPQLQESA